MVRTADGEAVFAGGEALVGALLGAADVAARALFLGAGRCTCCTHRRPQSAYLVPQL
jgi:hypothetical protein